MELKLVNKENEMYRIKFLDGTEKEFNTLVGADLQGAKQWSAV
jgi:hypothetical protein